MFRKLAILIAAVLISPVAAAADASIPDAVLATGSKLIPDFSESNVKVSPVSGLYEITMGPRLLYVSADGRYIIRGDVIDIEGGENVSETARKRARIDAVNGLGEDSMIVFAPQDVERTITVFTDVTCPYCAKLHNEVGQLNKAGIKVRYLAFPRAGVPSPVYDQMVSVWCADDQQKAMTDAKARRPVEPKKCDNPVAEHFQMGQLVGVGGTPTIVLEDGTIVSGYVPAIKLIGYAQEARAGN
jgi:thiol:disulfide interchange protein DsbC